MTVLLAAIVPSGVWAKHAPDGETRIKRESLPGNFAIEDERWSTQAPVLDVSMASHKVRLRWTSADSRLTAYYEDDGQTLRLGSELKPGSGSYTCATYGGAYAYGPAVGTAAAWRAGFPAMVPWLRIRCPHADDATLARYRAEFMAAADHFPAASARFRGVASEAFGGTARRCIAFEREPKIRPVLWEPRCIRWSGSKRR